MSSAEPTERQPLASVRVTRSVAVRLGVVSTASFFWSVALLGVVLEVITGRALEPITVVASSPLELLVGVLFVIVLLVLVVVPHELLHGLAMTRYGAAPSYGVGVSGFVRPHAYVQSSELAFTRNQLLVILLIPFVVITATGLVLLAVVQSPLLLVPIAANVAGSVSDLWMAAAILRYPSSARIAGLPTDRGQGLAVYDAASRRSSRRRSLERRLAAFVTGAAVTFTLLVFGLFTVVVTSLIVGSGDVVLGDPGGTWFLLRHELDPDEYAVSVELGGPVLVASSTLGGLAWAAGSAVVHAVSRAES
ncbi:DUF3267 domain-containing protein [Natronobeatus ordinarius]|uniref:DUF3267 domain-containing protein n=1 Tax=Natronobeatus ordinarius TaxID=2963433 RepID=UPI0020CBEE39|nr:DUF3267 domain-containing protein [Natronobeatus ordinarius]